MPRTRTLATAAAVAATAAWAQVSPNAQYCRFSPSYKTGVSYDACALASSTDYTWTDPTDFETTNSTYTFNVAVNVQNVPAPCTSLPASPAYQVTNNGGGAVCYQLGLDTTGRVVPAPTLFDSQNPARGWQMNYVGPARSGCPSNPGFSIIFLCNAQYPFPAPGLNNSAPFINEVSTCTYEAFSWSTVGCPTQCPRVNGQVCGGNGVCGYDDSAQTARCFCYDDWIESDCQTPRSPFPGGAVAGATIGGILLGLGIMLGAAYFMRSPAGASKVEGGDGFYH